MLKHDGFRLYVNLVVLDFNSSGNIVIWRKCSTLSSGQTRARRQRTCPRPCRQRRPPRHVFLSVQCRQCSTWDVLCHQRLVTAEGKILKVMEEVVVHEHRLTENGGADLATPPPSSLDVGWNDSIDYFIKKQLRVWCRLQNGQWELGKIQSAVGGKASVMLLDGTVMVVSTGELLPANTEILDGVDNLVGLCYLNEPSVLCNLQYRYDRDVIYTMAGPVLLAIKPFKDVLISGSDVIMAYREKILDSPHVYAIADAAYSAMMRDEVHKRLRSPRCC